MEKDVQFAFRVDSELREQFVRICREMDRPAGQILREYIRVFVADHADASVSDASPIKSKRQSKTEVSA